MQSTGHSFLVHQFVTVPWDFNPVPYCQPSSPTPMEYALPPSLEWYVWPGRRSIYNNRTTWNYLTVCERMSLGSFKNVMNRMCSEIKYYI